MNRYSIFFMAFFWMTFCVAQDDYYSLQPKQLQKALELCPDKAPLNTSCDELKTIALKINESAYQLRIDPQGYGKKILSLQQVIAKQELALRKQPKQAELRALLNENKRSLQERLAIVKWLESPEG